MTEGRYITQMRIENNHMLYRDGDYPCGREYILIPSGFNQKGMRTFTEIEVWEKVPYYKKEWKPVEGANTAPKGYVWISNGKSRFDPERRTALLRVEDKK